MVNLERLAYLVLAEIRVNRLVDRQQVVRVAPPSPQAQSQHRRALLLGRVLVVEVEKPGLF